MAGKRKSLFIWIIAAILGLLLILMAAIQLVLGTSLKERIVDKLGSDLIDGELSYSRLHISLLRSWPDLCVELDSLCICYPHERFDTLVIMPLQADGRGSAKDTLASCRSLRTAVAVLPMLRKRFEINRIYADKLRAFAHSYGDSLASWQLFRSSDSDDKDDEDGGGSLVLNLHKLQFTNSFLALSSVSGVWCLRGPLELDLGGRIEKDSLRLLIDARQLRLRWSDVPLEAAGRMEFWRDSTVMNLRADMHDAPLASLLPGFVHPFVTSLRGLSSDGFISIDAESEGAFAGGRKPRMRAEVELPPCFVSYKPLRVEGTVGLSADARSDESFVLDAVVDKLIADIPGLKLDARGRVDRLLGDDPRYKADLNADAHLRTLSRTLLKGSGVSADGDVNLKLDLDALQSQLNRYSFQNASIKGQLSGDRLDVTVDSLAVQTFRPLLRLNSNPEGIALGLDMDSTFVSNPSMLTRLRGSNTLARLHKVEHHGRMVPRIDIMSENDRLFLKTGDTRTGVSEARIMASATRRVMPDTTGLRARMRSDTSMMRRRMDYVKRESERSFKEQDIHLPLDSTITAYLREWSPNVSVRLGRGFVATPSMPLRTRIDGFCGEYDGRDFRLDSVSVRCGTSDVRASGEVKSVMRMFSRRHSFINTRLKIKSNRLNINELMAALNYGEKLEGLEETAEEDESFVLDSIPYSKTEHSSSVLVVPGNVDAGLELLVDRVDYQDFILSPLRAKASVRDNTLQILDLYTDADIAKINLDAYYASKSRSDIGAGVNLGLQEIRAEDVIALLPFVDDLIPALKSFKGRLNCNLSATAAFDEQMNLETPSLNGLLDISGHDLMIEDAGDLRRITRLLLFKNKDIGRIEDMSVSAVIKDNQAVIYPFQLSVDRYSLALQGVQGFDRSMDYHVSVLKSPFLIPFGIYIRGDLDDWRFGLCMPRYRNGNLPAYSRELDAVNFNLSQSIKDIYSIGVDGVKRHNQNSLAQLESAGMGRKEGVSDELLSSEEYNQIDSMMLDAEIAAQEEELRSSIESLLSSL